MGDTVREDGSWPISLILQVVLNECPAFDPETLSLSFCFGDRFTHSAFAIDWEEPTSLESQILYFLAIE